MRRASTGVLVIVSAVLVVLTTNALGADGDREREVGGGSTADALRVESWRTSCAGRAPTPRRVFVSPDANLGRLVAHSPRRTTFCIRAGVHRFKGSVVPKEGSAFIGQPGAIWSGARDITGRFGRAGSHWVAAAMTMEGIGRWSEADPCGLGESTLCLRTNDVFYDDRWLTRVGSLPELSFGEFFFDYARDRIHIADNPAGHNVEVGLVTQALRSFRTAADNVIVRGLVIEKFATPVNSYTLEGNDGWVLDDVEIRLNHACGAAAEVLRDSIVHDNGQCGFSTADNDGALVENNEFYENHRTPIAGWHTAAVKILRSRNAVIRNNFVHDEDSIGLWTDWDNVGTIYDGNRTVRTGGPGIFHEASCSAVIRNNVIRRAGFGRDFEGWIDGSGILVQTSRNVEIYGNLVEGSKHGIGATSTTRGSGKNCGEFATHNLRVHDNTIVVGAGRVAAGIAGIVTQPFTSQAFYDRNRYVVCSLTQFSGPAPASATTHGGMRWAEWRALGQDPNSSVFTTC